MQEFDGEQTFEEAAQSLAEDGVPVLRQAPRPPADLRDFYDLTLARLDDAWHVVR